MLKPNRILETCLYARDLDVAAEFYTTVLGFDIFSRDTNRHVFIKCDESMLLIFNPDRTMELGTEIPPHGSYGHGHVCFAIDENELDSWREHLQAHGVPIETEIAWPAGGKSIYFRDPAGNSIELGSPAVWGFK